MNPINQRFYGRDNAHQLLYQSLKSPYQQYPILSKTRRNGVRDQQHQPEIIGYEVRLSSWNMNRRSRSNHRCMYQGSSYRRKKQNLELSPTRSRPKSVMRPSRQKSAPGCMRDANGEPCVRVSSAYDRRTRNNHEESDLKLMENSSDLACEVTMVYGSKLETVAKSDVLDEVVIMQQRSTGENRIVYRGFLSQGDTFSFKSHHRSVSPVCLAFYIKGLIDGVVYDCCEFNYRQKQLKNNHHHGRFHVESVGKTDPCEKCQNRTVQEMNTDSNDLKSEERKPKEHSTSKRIVLKSSTKSSIKEAEEQVTRPKTSEVVKKESGDVSKPTVVKVSKSSSDAKPTSPETPPIVKLEKKSSDGEHTEKREAIPISLRDYLSLLQGMCKKMMNKREFNNSRRTDVTKTIRHPNSVENFVYVLDERIPMPSEDKNQLHHLINFGSTFTDINSDECLKFINQMTCEQVILILSKESIEELDENIKQHSKVLFIYVIDPSLVVYNTSVKICGSFAKVSDLNRQLAKDLIRTNADLINILSISANNIGASAFAYAQILKEILIANDDQTNLKSELLDFSREIYAQNPFQMKFIARFESQYQATQALEWYSESETFISKMLTRALRVPEPDLLFKCRYFIQDLHNQIKSQTHSTEVTLYRTFHVPKKIFDEIQGHQDGFLSFNQFLFASKVQEKQASMANAQSDHQWMMFQMQLGKTIPRAAIDGNGNQFVLPLYLPFKIVNIESNDDGIPCVRLISNDEILRTVHELTKELREASRGSFPLLRMAKLMRRLEYMQHTEYFSLLLLNDPFVKKTESANFTLGSIFHALGSYYYEQREYDHAFKRLENALEVYLRVLPSDHPKLSPTYNNMGSIYHKQGFDEKALKFHKIAYDIQMKSGNPDIDSVAAYSANIASVLAKLGRYDEAILYLERELKIRQKVHGDNENSELALKYHNLAGAQFRAHKYQEALENYKKCLNIELKCFLPLDPTVGVTYYNMATAYEALGQLEEAIDTIRKGIERLLETKTENDEEVKMQKQYEQKLHQKLWVKSLFATENTD